MIHPNKCYEICPEGKRYLIQNSYECSSGCTEEYPYKIKDEKGHIICYQNFPCTGDEVILNYECVQPNKCKELNKPRINSKNTCVPECETGYNSISEVVEGVYKCIQICTGFYLNNNICVEKCPMGYNYIGANRKCKIACESSDGLKYYEVEEITSDSSNSYSIFQCTSSCNQEYSLEKYDNSDKRCYNKCPNSHKYEYNNKCYDLCIRNNLAPFSVTRENNGDIENICSIGCLGTDLNYDEDKVCKNRCDTAGKALIDYDNQCVEKCNQNSDYKYISEDNTKCVDTCANHYILNGKCVAGCDTDTYFLNPIKKNLIETGNKECVLNCPKKYFKTNTDITPNERICLDQCSSTDYALIDTFECVSSCDIPDNTNPIYHSYEPGRTYSIKTCVKECPSEKPYLNTDNNACVSSCRALDKYLSSDNKCIDECSTGKYYIGQFLSNDYDTENKCLTDCPQRYPYYIESSDNSATRYICSSECPDGLKFHKNSVPDKIGMKCKDECDDDDYKYLSDDEKECLISCPIGKYYVEEENRKCLDACPEDHPFHSKNDFKCFKIEDCPNKFIDYQNKLCISSCEGFKFQYEENDPNNSNELLYTICLNDCSIYNNKYQTPDDRCVDSCLNTENLVADDENQYKCKCINLFYKDITTSKVVCVEQDNVCADNDNYKISRYDTKECLHSCPDVLTLNGKVCFKEEEDKCDSNRETIISTLGKKQCNCIYKYYINDSEEKVCLNSEDKCPTDFYNPITKQCVADCTGLKKFQNLCLVQCPGGATLDGTECKCSGNWYQISEYNFQCIPGTCIESHSFLIPEIKQCVSNCKNTEYPLLVNNQCYSSCDSLTNTELTDIENFRKEYEFATKTCQCKNLWYYDESQKKNECPSDEKTSCKEFTGKNFNYLVKKTKQCVVACPSDYSYSFNDECFHSCESAKNEFNLDVIKTSEDSKICKCRNLWKYETNDDIKKIVCLTETQCPDNSLLIFDTNECFELEDANNKICPLDSPLEFNDVCYKENSCPQNSYFNPEYAGKCTCDNLWYIDENTNLIHCLPKETPTCPNDYKYQIYKTKQCIKPVETYATKCPEDNHYVFNLICYENSCPENTKEDSANSKICICDETKGKWYKLNNDNNGITYYTCGLEECPQIKPNLLDEKKQCTFNCDEDGESTYIWAFRNLCREECPEFTVEDSTQKSCVPHELTEAENLEQLNNYVSVQVKELYENGPRGGNIFNGLDSSLQIYPVNKLGDSPIKDIVMKSNLTYINLDNCINKIFEDQRLDEDDNIFIVKYDLINTKKEEPENNNNGGDGNGDGNSNPNPDSEPNPNPDPSPNNENENKDIKNSENYLINEVEYEFYSSKTLEKIDASVCSSKEIIISYPISYTMAKFDNNADSFNLNEYRQKFNLGKELYHQDNTIDIFDFNNSIYKELCTPLEINGKDLVYEQRYEILYPNNITLCEKNCTLYYTDYELGRINCKCDYKEILDFNREMPSQSDLLNDPNFYKPSQSGANAEIIKCISKLPNKDSIIKNEAFYYSIVVIAGEISMVCVAGFYGIKLIKNNIHNLGRKMNGNNNTGNKNKNNIDNIGMTSNRMLYNNPPKKNNMIVNDDLDNNDISNELNKYVKENNTKDKKPYNIIKKRIIFNVNKNINENNSEDNESNDIDIKDIDVYSKNYNNELIKIKDIKGKAEFIPPEYNFKFFKPSDTGIKKQISRKEIPFKIKSSTKYLLEQKENIKYNTNYLNGPIYANQNMIEIIEENNDIIEKEENGLNKKIVYKNTNEDNNNISVRNKKDKVKTRTITSEKSFINIKTIIPKKKSKEVEEYIEEEEYPNQNKKLIESVSLYSLIKKEQAMLRTPYRVYAAKDHSNLLAIILAEIMDKIYLIKICCFLKPFELFSVHLFNYLIYHIVLFSLLCAFFTVKTIKKIYTDDFPKLNFYLLYGFISSIIIWVVYRLFLTLIDHRDKINDLIKLRQELNKNEKNENNFEENKTEKDDEISEELYEMKYNDLIKRIKINLIIFFIIGFLITIFCAIYLISFFAIYTGTKSKVIKAYYITLIEIVLIKFVYGLCLASLRKAGETNEIENVYKVPYICNKYIS